METKLKAVMQGAGTHTVGWHAGKVSPTQQTVRPSSISIMNANVDRREQIPLSLNAKSALAACSSSGGTEQKRNNEAAANRRAAS
mmetsp:Transcript_9993/g.25504  ORF Transcript_9993/g.25504 Transcript_9993/m.25504 type:complete len:85 (-) Transcript_9993:281-535(-)